MRLTKKLLTGTLLLFALSSASACMEASPLNVTWQQQDQSYYPSFTSEEHPATSDAINTALKKFMDEYHCATPATITFEISVFKPELLELRYQITRRCDNEPDYREGEISFDPHSGELLRLH